MGSDRRSATTHFMPMDGIFQIKMKAVSFLRDFTITSQIYCL
jgi:hypothetical protein